jgi:hypothetical protein
VIKLLDSCYSNLSRQNTSKAGKYGYRRFRGLIALLMEAVQTSVTLVNSHQSARRHDPEDSHLYSHRRENLKSYLA